MSQNYKQRSGTIPLYQWTSSAFWIEGDAPVLEVSQCLILGEGGVPVLEVSQCWKCPSAGGVPVLEVSQCLILGEGGVQNNKHFRSGQCPASSIPVIFWHLESELKTVFNCSRKLQNILNVLLRSDKISVVPA